MAAAPMFAGSIGSSSGNGRDIRDREAMCTDDDPPDPPPPSPPPPQPTNDISSTPLTPDQVHAALSRIESGNLAAVLRSLGEDTSGKSAADLVAAAWNRFEAAMGNLDLGQVDAAGSAARWEEGQGSWVYYTDRIAG
ncbi:MAG: hypothetical protein Q9202_006225 [Teloschistes flavicans]